MISFQIINYILNTKDTSLIVLNNLTDKYFPDYKKEFNFILNHFKQYGNIPDKETFLNIFPDFDLIEVNESPKYLIEELFKDYQKNQLAYTFNNVRKYLIEGDTEKAVEVYQNSYESISTGISLQSIDILKDTSRYNDYVERLSDFDKYYVRTGFPELDGIIGGWDREEELGLIVARTNKGKSWILLKCVLAAAEQGLNVGVYSGEMSEKKVGYRIDTLLQHLPNGSLIHGNPNIQADYQTYINNLPNRLKGSIKIITPLTIGGSAGVNALRAFIEKDKLDILFIDQISLMDDDRHAKNPVEKVNNIANDLKLLQVMKKIPIISVSQQNRNKNDDGDDVIDTSQVALSDKLAQNSTFILGITRDKKDNSLTTLHIIKSRDSVVGNKITYKVDFNRGEFTYIPEGNEKIDKEENYNDRYKTPVNNSEEVFD